MPAKASEIALCFELGRATVVVEEDQLSLAIGRHGQNVRLAARLTGWDIDILTPDEYNQGIERLTKCVKSTEGADETLVDKLIALGIISILDLDDVGAEPLVTELNIKPDLAQRLITAAVEEAKNMAADAKQKQADELLLKEQSQPKQTEELLQEQPQPKQAEGLIQEQAQPNQPADSTNQT
jgi:N utilization substance protein A